MTGVDGSDVAKGDTGRVTTACVLEDRDGKCHPLSPWVDDHSWPLLSQMGVS